ncbi:hypothetical protein [Seonamhaeicola maritimus]|uniref:T9SS type A sorting domain-containing protein n=1 Tax=Seonamhaeicola maritimus TaxID=2591822 RepID=A0A5C7GCZ6_9FLAO|nr:hypothetical protein [Seonamhaeicola maritimus]TXG34493.1 hypothetical protein FUA22_17905 [Seonamhaeicola maritimus]
MTPTYRLCVFIFLLVVTSTSFAKNNNYSAGNYAEASYSSSEIQRVRIYFTSPNGLVRHLLLGFTSDDAATDGFDFGYDALNRDNIADDLNWIIEDERYLIQGVGAFEDTKKYPLGMFLKNTGTIKIDLNQLENFNTDVDVFIYDSLLDSYTRINETTYTNDMQSGEYLNRFYIAFKDNSEPSAAKSLSTSDETLVNTRINYLHNSKEILVDTNNTTEVQTINIFNINGQLIRSLSHVNKSYLKIPMYENIKNIIVSIETDFGATSKLLMIH